MTGRPIAVSEKGEGEITVAMQMLNEFGFDKLSEGLRVDRVNRRPISGFLYADVHKSASQEASARSNPYAAKELIEGNRPFAGALNLDQADRTVATRYRTIAVDKGPRFA